MDRRRQRAPTAAAAAGAATTTTAVVDDLDGRHFGTLVSDDRVETEKPETDVDDEEGDPDGEHADARVAVELDDDGRSSDGRRHGGHDEHRLYPVPWCDGNAQLAPQARLLLHRVRCLAHFAKHRRVRIVGTLNEPVLEAFVMDSADVTLAGARLDQRTGVGAVAVVADPALGLLIPAFILIFRTRILAVGTTAAIDF